MRRVAVALQWAPHREVDLAVDRPIPTDVFHMTRLEHLPSIVQHGLLADSSAQPLIEVEIGNRSIKADRRLREVGAGPGGVVADYVPFYFTPLSPMQYSIHMGNVPTYHGGTREIAFLRTTTQRLRAARLEVVTSDRNARQTVAQFTATDSLDDFIDWGLMVAKYWTRFSDGSERRQAECLVHLRVPWDVIEEIGVRDRKVASEVVGMLRGLDTRDVAVSVRRGWYF